jgi:hypothetical protein
MADTTLQALVLLELDTLGDLFIVWKLPSIEPVELSKIITTRSFIRSEELVSSFSKYKDKWLYIVNDFGHGRVKKFAVCLIASEFNPEKYLSLVRLMTKAYSKALNPVRMLQIFMDVYTKGEFSDADIGTFKSTGFDQSKDHLLASSLFDIVKAFEDSSWMIWSALMMKKRVAVFADDYDALLKFLRALPLFVLHRMDWSLLRPLVTFDNEEEVADLKITGVYVAGFLDSRIRTRSDLFDVLIDVSKSTITLANDSTDDFIETKLHADLSQFVKSALATEGIDNPKIVKAYKLKTQELLAKLNTLKEQQEGDDKAYISFASLNRVQLPPHLDAFLYAVASAEGMTKLSAAS